MPGRMPAGAAAGDTAYDDLAVGWGTGTGAVGSSGEVFMAGWASLVVVRGPRRRSGAPRGGGYSKSTPYSGQ